MTCTSIGVFLFRKRDVENAEEHNHRSMGYRKDCDSSLLANCVEKHTHFTKEGSSTKEDEVDVCSMRT